MKMKRPDLARYAPPGQEMGGLRRLYVTVLVLAALYSAFCFGARLFMAYQSLFRTRGGKRELILGRVMPRFSELADSTFVGFWLVAALMVCCAVYFVTCFYHGSKSIYLMRRLPSRWELPRRVLTLPAVGVGLCLISILVLCALYVVFYLMVTPEGCLPTQPLGTIWSVILCWS